MSAIATQFNLDETALKELEGSFRGELDRPGSPAYDEHRRIWNGSIDRSPALIARCAGVADVIVSSAHADVMCIGKPVCDPTKDFLTGGGWIDRPSGAKEIGRAHV